MALHRSLGSLAGVLLVVALAFVLPKTMPLQVPAISLGVITALNAIRHGHPAFTILALTATIVLFNSTHSDLIGMADQRLLANGVGIGISLALMAIAQPIEQRLLRMRIQPRLTR